MTKKQVTTIETAIADAKIMTAADFEKKYEDKVEWLDVDNIMDLNEGTVNIQFSTGTGGAIDMLFIDGQYQD